MASNHVHLDKHHQPGQQFNGYHDNLFQPSTSSHNGQPYDSSAAASWNYDQRQQPQQQPPPQNVPRPGSAWQQHQQQHTLPSAFDSNSIYGRDYSDSPTPYQNQPLPASSHGATRPQFDPHHQQAALDPALMTNTTNPMYPPHSATQTTSTPQALPSYGASYQQHQKLNPPGQLRDYSSTPPTTTASLSAPVPKFPPAPKPVQRGNFLIVDHDELSRATNSIRLDEFVNIGNDALDLPTMKSAVPLYQPRRSRAELKKLAASDARLAGICPDPFQPIQLLMFLGKITKASKKAKTPAEKLMRTKPFGLGSPATIKDEATSSSSETESSEEDSDYSSDEEPPEPSPLPAVRPTEMLQRVRYDTIKALWRPRNLPVSAEDIRIAIRDFWEIVSTIRNRFKGDKQALQDAEEKKMRDLDQLRDRVKDQRDQFEMAVKCALEHGHPGIIRLLGANPAFINAVYQFLADRIKDKEYNDLFSKAVIELIARVENLTFETLEKTNLIKAFNRYLIRGDDRQKSLVERIIARAKENSKKNEKEKDSKKAEVKKDNVKKEPDAAKTKVEPVSQPSTVAGVKRPRPADGVSAVPVKKTAMSTTSATSKLATASGVKKPGLAATAPSTNGAASAASKPKMAPKPNMFPGLQSASKKSAVTNGSKPTVAAAKKPAAAAPRFSFAETMANLTKPKQEKPAAKPEENRPPESEEERAKRLRKEQRRKLRVKWVDNENAGQLVSVRLFTHDPEEELGHDAAMVRDVDDVGGEGRMFKQHKDQMDLDEDDDRPGEEELRRWISPSLVDFSNVPQDEKARNYEPYGGGSLKPDSPEKGVQEQHEVNTLMVFYPSRADIPPNPRDPPSEDVEQKEPTPFGTPSEIVLQRASKLAPAPAPGKTAAGPDFSRLVEILQSSQQQPQPSPPQPEPQNPFSNLEKTFSMFSQPQQPPAQPSTTSAGPIDVTAILASLSNMNTQPQQSQPQPQQPAPQPTAFANLTMPNLSSMPAMPTMPAGFDLSAIFNTAAASSGASPFNMLQPQGQPQNAAQAPPPSQPSSQQSSFEEDRKRGRSNDAAAGDGRDGGFKKGKKWRGGRGPNGEYQPPQFVLPCRFWKEGKCIKGDKCTYLHGE
ncbi:hypothetical protein HDK77DRAFT_39408 [Phyllosticta capitalensis]